MKRDFDNTLFYKISHNHNSGHIKFFTFLEETYGTESLLFPLIAQYLENEKSAEYQEHFDLIYYVSLYSFQAQDHRGVLIKGQTKKLKNITKCIDSLTKRFGVTTTTYICSQPLFGEMDEPNSIGNKPLPSYLRKSAIVYNLLKSHDCYLRQFKHIESAGVVLPVKQQKS